MPSPCFSPLRCSLLPADHTTLVLGESVENTSVSFALCHELSKDFGEWSLFVCNPNHFRHRFPLPVSTSFFEGDDHKKFLSGYGRSCESAVGDGSVFSPGALKRIRLLYPESTPDLLALLMEASFPVPPCSNTTSTSTAASFSSSPTVVVIDDLSSLIDPVRATSLSSPVFLKQALTVLSHVQALATYLSRPSQGSSHAHLVRVIITDSRLKQCIISQAHGEDGQAYFSLLLRFCSRTVALTPPTPLCPAMVLLSPAAPTAAASGDGEGKVIKIRGHVFSHIGYIASNYSRSLPLLLIQQSEVTQSGGLDGSSDAI